MRIFRTLRTAVRALRRNIMRSILTTIGIVIGIASVIAMMEIGNGVSEQMQKSILALGANNLMIFPASMQSGGVSSGSGGRITLTVQDAEAIAERCPAVRAVAPLINTSGQVIYGGNNWRPDNTFGTTPEYFDVRDWPIREGEAFTDRDVQTSAPVCVLGSTVARELFKGQNPIGKEVRIQGVNLRVVGVLASKGANMFGRDQDDMLMAPWTTMRYRISGGSSSPAGGASGSSSGAGSGSAANSLNNPYPASPTKVYPDISAVQQQNEPMPIRFQSVNMLTCAAVSPELTRDAIEQITEVLRERHRIAPGEPDDFNVRDMTELGNTFGKNSALMTNLLLIVAAISLVVGGVGIMNIMLVSVTERTREIGLRMAVGARARDILTQFLVEAVLLCLAGGLLGIGLGELTSWLVWKFAGWATATSWPAIFVSVAVSAVVGVAFGFYPAWKASRLDPIDALRYE